MTNNFQRWKGIMKAYPFSEERLLKWEPPFICQPKYDGVRCRAIRLENGNYILLSSEENLIFSVPHINESLNSSGLNIELDGELYCHGMSFEEIVSITSRTVNLHENHKAIQFHCFDVVMEADQLMRLKKVVEIGHLNIPNLITSPYWFAESLDDVMRIFDTIINKGYEGIIVRHFANIYERKRSTLVMKFKPKKEDDYKIVGFKEEISVGGIPKNTLGALECLSGDGNIFSVGTGFSEDMRNYLWKEKDLLIGKLAKVKYQHITSGKKVPRFPVFVEITNGMENSTKY